ncbi:Permease of the drug/metabolite transporter (DMT) superfamily [Natronorubrum sediminis]|uniref:Permease of the drug/metabolite transporter (DMT) superfamily n=1 Tax=Natronorubrum sediminis TaxID=640943 RepID=A0A1H6FVA7_9EURY|nr:Permease of the drug/metabolite transporter (DMT) superfamily [Natronorubrum sediminis]
MSRVRRYRNALLFISLAGIWGTAFVAISAGLEHFPPVLFAAFRYDIAGVLMLAYAVYAVDDWYPTRRGEWLLVAVGATLLIAAYHVFLFVGQQHTTAAAAAIVVSLSPVLTTGFARVLTPTDALSSVGIVGLAFGLVGVGLVARPDPEQLLTTDVVAILLVFCAATAFALGGVVTRSLEATLPIETLEAWSMLGGALIMHAVSLALGEPLEPTAWTHPEAVGALGYLALVASAIGFLLYFDLLERLGAVEINMVSYVAPVFAALFGWLYLGEVVDAATVVGFGFIAAGFVLVKRTAIRSEFDHLVRRFSSE